MIKLIEFSIRLFVFIFIGIPIFLLAATASLVLWEFQYIETGMNLFTSMMSGNNINKKEDEKV